MVTQYPSKIDDSTSLPEVVDLASIFSSDVYNRLRNAIIAIETELGAQPSAAYTSVKNRFDVLENTVGNLQIISLSGDLGGSLNTPTVIGLRGRTISTTAPTVGQFLSWNGSVWLPANAPTGSFSAAGDLSGNGTSQTVEKVKGTSITTAGGALTTGKVLKVTGSASADWAAIVNADISSSAAIDYSKLGTGTQSFGAQQFNSTVDGYGTIKDVQPKNVRTTDATVTTLDSFTIASNTVLVISSVITAIKSDNSQGASYLRTASFRNTGGTVTQIGATQDGGTFEDDSTWNATIDNSTTTIRIRVTGKAATTIRWTCVSTRLEVIV